MFAAVKRLCYLTVCANSFCCNPTQLRTVYTMLIIVQSVTVCKSAPITVLYIKRFQNQKHPPAGNLTPHQHPTVFQLTLITNKRTEPHTKAAVWAL